MQNWVAAVEENGATAYRMERLFWNALLDLYATDLVFVESLNSSCERALYNFGQIRELWDVDI